MSPFFYFISINYCTIQTQNYKNEMGCKKIISNTFIGKPVIKELSKIKLLQELPFLDELSIQMHLVDMQEVIKLKLLIKKIL